MVPYRYLPLAFLLTACPTPPDNIPGASPSGQNGAPGQPGGGGGDQGGGPGGAPGGGPGGGPGGPGGGGGGGGGMSFGTRTSSSAAPFAQANNNDDRRAVYRGS